MKNFLNITLVLLAGLVLAACQTSQQSGPTPGDVVAGYALGDVTISVSEEYSRAFGSLQEDKVALIRDGLEAQVKANLEASLPPKFKGQPVADVKVLFTHLGLATAGGRVLLGQDSFITGTVSIVERETSSLLLTREIVARDAGLKGQGAVGLAVALVVNIANSSDTKRVSNIAKSFDQQTNFWLKQKK